LDGVGPGSDKSGPNYDNTADVAAWSQALVRTGRDIQFVISWSLSHEYVDTWQRYTNGWRVDTDVECYCETVSSWDSSVKARWADLPSWLGVFGPQYRPDLDSMPISNNTGSGIQDGISDVERQSVMTFWSMASSPLYVGGDIYFLDASAVSILTNPEVIAVDHAGSYPTQVTGGNLQVWTKRAPGGRTYAAVYNLGSTPADITVDLHGTRPVRDVVARTDLGRSRGSWTASAVPPHGSRLIRIG
jgi:hypothetical protein